MTDRILIVGAGHSGGACAIALRDQGFSGPITILGDEDEPPYERPSLSKEFLKTPDARPVYLLPENDWAALDIELRLGRRAVSVSRADRRLHLQDGTELDYDRLVIATGGRPRALPGPAHPEVHYLRTAADARRVARRLPAGGRAVVVGGGVIGLEIASTLREARFDVVVLEAGDRLLGRNVPPAAADRLAAAHAAAGVDIRLGRTIRRIDGAAPATLTLDDGASLEADLLIAGIGIEACVDWLGEAFAGAQGVEVDEDYRSVDDPRVFAIGDVALRRRAPGAAPSRMETWAHAQTSARAAAAAIAGRPREAEPAPWFWTDQCGRTLQIAGDPAQGDRLIERGEAVQFYLKDGVLAGVVCLDAPRDFAAARRLIGRRLDPVGAADPAVDLRKIAA